MNNVGNLGYSRAKALHPTLVLKVARKQRMKLYVYTANGLQRRRCGEIGLPGGEKVPMDEDKRRLWDFDENGEKYRDFL